MKIGVLTVSDRGASGIYEDRSGPLITDIITERTGWQVTQYSVISDDLYLIAETLRSWQMHDLSLILTTGGTGFSPRDVTPEATRMVIEREAPGIAEALRAESLKVTRHAMLSRGIAGIVGKTLIVNLPGSPKAVKENLETLLPVLPHALTLLTDQAGSEAQHRAV